MLADEVDYVIGVDTHRDEHVLVIVTAPAGAVIARQSVGTNARGYAEAVRFAADHAAGARTGRSKEPGTTAPASPAT
jgi:transposase